MALLRRKEYYRENYPNMKGFDNIVVKITPSEKITTFTVIQCNTCIYASESYYVFQNTV